MEVQSRKVSFFDREVLQQKARLTGKRSAEPSQASTGALQTPSTLGSRQLARSNQEQGGTMSLELQAFAKAVSLSVATKSDLANVAPANKKAISAFTVLENQDLRSRVIDVTV